MYLIFLVILQISVEYRYADGIEIIKEVMKKDSHKAAYPVVFTSMLRSGSDTDNEVFYPKDMKEVYALSQTPQVSLDHQVYNRDGKYVFVWDYVSQLYNEEEIKEYFNKYTKFIEKIAEENDWSLI